MWKHMEQPGRSAMTIWRTRITCWIIKVTDTNSEYVIFIVFPLQQWLHEGVWILRYTYIACLVNSKVTNNSWINPRCCSTWLRLADFSEGTVFRKHKKSEIQYTESTIPRIYKNTNFVLIYSRLLIRMPFPTWLNYITKFICGWEMWTN